MDCDELDLLIEPLAAGEQAATPEIAAHLQTCSRCRDAYGLARAIDRTLARQPAPALPESFVTAVVARIRRQRWRSEQHLDLAFNVVVASAVAVAIGGLYAVMTVSGLAAVSADVVRVVVHGALDLSARAAPQLHVYLTAALLIVSGLGLWWWAEQGFET